VIQREGQGALRRQIKQAMAELPEWPNCFSAWSTALRPYSATPELREHAPSPDFLASTKVGSRARTAMMSAVNRNYGDLSRYQDAKHLPGQHNW
jgi:hypothetical protein